MFGMDKKNCSHCGLILPVDSFRWKNREKNLRQSYCIECNKKYSKKHYKENKDKYLAKAKVYNNQYKKEISDRLLEYFQKNHCVDCGNSDPRVLEFDHVRGKKSANIASMITYKKSWDEILDEISKCDVRCSNCHRIVTSERSGSYRMGWL